MNFFYYKDFFDVFDLESVCALIRDDRNAYIFFSVSEKFIIV